ncbi:hypothetical protein TcWFU_006114 [Taenia crassiceps]|uniref:Uncharacterized protein n=1 Tax=Taenia crassiceps TaxID=6207 RepID=A0ABR4Q3K4_9CEST
MSANGNVVLSAQQIMLIASGLMGAVKSKILCNLTMPEALTILGLDLAAPFGHIQALLRTRLCHATEHYWVHCNYDAQNALQTDLNGKEVKTNSARSSSTFTRSLFYCVAMQCF